MPKLMSGGVRINPMKNGTFALNSGSDYQLGEEAELIEDLVAFAKSEEKPIAAYVPDAKVKKVNGGYTAAQITEFAETLEPTLMIGFGNGFPAPYLAFFGPDSKPKNPNRKKAKKSKYARS